MKTLILAKKYISDVSAPAVAFFSKGERRHRRSYAWYMYTMCDKTKTRLEWL